MHPSIPTLPAFLSLIDTTHSTVGNIPVHCPGPLTHHLLTKSPSTDECLVDLSEYGLRMGDYAFLGVIHTANKHSPQVYAAREKASHGHNANPVYKASAHKDPSLCTFAPATTTSFLPSATMSFRYYQPPKQIADSDSDEYSSDNGKSYGRRRQNSVSDNSGSKRAGACTHCKTLKVKCHFTPGQKDCNRCQISRLNCVVFGRKKRRAVPTHEELMRKSRKQDMEITALLHRIDTMSTERNISEWISKSRPNSRNPSETSSKSSDMGVEASRLSLDQRLSNIHRSEEYARCNWTKEQLFEHFSYETFDKNAAVPAVVSCGLLTPHDVDHLFDLYFRVVNPYFSILDQHLHTAPRLFWKSHFLFTVICSVASRFYEGQPHLHTSLFEFAKDCCGKALVGDVKTIDNCQAFLLMAVYQLPRRHWVQQRGWLYMGVAFRLAIELKLNETCDSAVDQREQLNRTRTWLNCYCVDASHATQFGKPAMISVEDYVARNSRYWYRSSPFNLPIDIHLVAYVEVLQTMGRFKADTESSAGRNKRTARDCLVISKEYNSRLNRLRDEWSGRFAEQSVPPEDEFVCAYRADLHRMINAYSRLVVLVFGFQRAAAVRSGIAQEGLIDITRLCIATAHEVIDSVIIKLAPTGFLKFGMEAHSLFVSFAAAFLINLLQPNFSFLLEDYHRVYIHNHVRALIVGLRSKKVASEVGHAPNSPLIYARFLHALLDRNTPVAPTEVSTPARPATTHTSIPTPLLGGVVEDWAYTGTSNAIYPNIGSVGYQGGIVDAAYPQFRGADMDFSLNHFLQTISTQPQLLQPSPPPNADPSFWSEALFPNNQSLSGTFAWPMVMEENGYAPHQYEEYS